MPLISSVDRRLWIVGRRELIDTLVDNVDVYSIEAGMWTTPEERLPPRYQRSDHSDFAVRPTEAIFMGCYEFNYAQLVTVFAIQAASDNNLGMEDRAPLSLGGWGTSPPRQNDLIVCSILSATQEEASVEPSLAPCSANS